MPEKTKARGRKPLPTGSKRTGRLSLKFLPAARSQIDKAAALDKNDAAGWGRIVCELAADYRVVHGITIQEAFAEAMKARGLAGK